MLTDLWIALGSLAMTSMTSTTSKIKDSIMGDMYFNDFDIEDSCFNCQHNDFRETMIIIICL